MYEYIWSKESIIADEEIQNLLLNEDNSDKYNYLAAIGSGALGGLIDIFLVDVPGSGALGKWSDKQANQVIISFAKKLGWSAEGKVNPERSAFQFLENKYSVPYDQVRSSQTADKVKLTPGNHHLKSLGHSSDIIGLFFSLLNQFTYTSSFIEKGKIITVQSDKRNPKKNSAPWELQGQDFQSKLYCGVVNWFGHIMSDVAGSSQTFKSEGKKNRGRGIAIPFFELLQFADFGTLQVEKQMMTFADISIKVYEKGYDFRHGMAMSIPVIITELSIRLICTLRNYFEKGFALHDSIPTMYNRNFRVMLLFGHGTLSILDGLDAGFRSGSNPILFIERLNLVAWTRFIYLIFKEITIHFNLEKEVEKQLHAYKLINQELDSYLQELENIDIERYQKEIEIRVQFTRKIEAAESSEELIKTLENIYEELEIEKPYKNDFDNFMMNKINTLSFKAKDKEE